MTFATKPQRIAHTRAEKELHKLLTLEPLSVPVKTQAPEGRCRLDFFFPDWKLAVELDGPWHDAAADRQRDAGLAKVGITVLRLPAEMPAPQLRRHIVYVAQRLLYLPLADRIHFASTYDPAVLDRLQAEPTPASTTGPQEACLDCSGSGWKMVPAWSNFFQRAEFRATRCQCTNLRDDSTLTLATVDVPALLRERLARKPPMQSSLFAARRTA